MRDDSEVEVLYEDGAVYKAFVTDVFENEVQVDFENNQIVETKFPFRLVKLPPAYTCIPDYTENREVEVFSKCSDQAPSGWRKAFIKMIRGEYHVVVAYIGYDRLILSEAEVELERLRPVNSNPPIDRNTFIKIEISVPERLRECAMLDGVHNEFQKKVNACVCRYIPERGVHLVISRSEMLLHSNVLKMYFRNLQKTFKLVKRSERAVQNLNYTKLRKSSEFSDEFHVRDDLMGLAMGRRDENLRLARQLYGITGIDVYKLTSKFKIHGKTAEAVRKARRMLEYKVNTLMVPRDLAELMSEDRKIIQEIIDRSGLASFEISNEFALQTSFPPEYRSEIPISLVGSVESLCKAKTLVTRHIEEFKKSYDPEEQGIANLQNRVIRDFHEFHELPMEAGIDHTDHGSEENTRAYQDRHLKAIKKEIIWTVKRDVREAVLELRKDLTSFVWKMISDVKNDLREMGSELRQGIKEDVQEMLRVRYEQQKVEPDDSVKNQNTTSERCSTPEETQEAQQHSTSASETMDDWEVVSDLLTDNGLDVHDTADKSHFGSIQDSKLVFKPKPCASNCLEGSTYKLYDSESLEDSSSEYDVITNDKSNVEIAHECFNEQVKNVDKYSESEQSNAVDFESQQSNASKPDSAVYWHQALSDSEYSDDSSTSDDGSIKATKSGFIRIPRASVMRVGDANKRISDNSSTEDLENETTKIQEESASLTEIPKACPSPSRSLIIIQKDGTIQEEERENTIVSGSSGTCSPRPKESQQDGVSSAGSFSSDNTSADTSPSIEQAKTQSKHFLGVFKHTMNSIQASRKAIAATQLIPNASPIRAPRHETQDVFSANSVTENVRPSLVWDASNRSAPRPETRDVSSANSTTVNVCPSSIWNAHARSAPRTETRDVSSTNSTTVNARPPSIWNAPARIAPRPETRDVSSANSATVNARPPSIWNAPARSASRPETQDVSFANSVTANVCSSSIWRDQFLPEKMIADLTLLNDMGFLDEKHNLHLLRIHPNNLEMVIESLVNAGP